MTHNISTCLSFFLMYFHIFTYFSLFQHKHNEFHPPLFSTVFTKTTTAEQNIVLSVVWHHSLLLMNGFNKTEAAVSSCRLCFLRDFPFISLILLTTAGVQCLCGGCKTSPRTTSLCSHIFLVLRDHGVYMYDVYV